MKNEGEQEYKRLRQEEQYDRLRQGLLEYFKVAIDVHKHLTTLCAGSLVLMGTFLKDIFSDTELRTSVNRLATFHTWQLSEKSKIGHMEDMLSTRACYDSYVNNLVGLNHPHSLTEGGQKKC
jgi:hypothetical protein